MHEIRPATISDHPKIVQLWHQGWHDAHGDLVPSALLRFRTQMYFVKWLTESEDYFYFATDDDLLGFVSVKGTEVVKLYVRRNARGTGAARSLLAFAEHTLFKSGVRDADLLCTAGNSRAEAFYRREGWSLSRSFDDGLWMPQGVGKQFIVPTLHFKKDFDL